LIHAAELPEKLKELGISYRQTDEISRPGQLPPIQASNAKRLAEVLDVSGRLADRIAELVGQGAFPLVLGGDHSVSIGTVAGLAEHYANLGVIWFDAHSD